MIPLWVICRKCGAIQIKSFHKIGCGECRAPPEELEQLTWTNLQKYPEQNSHEL